MITFTTSDVLPPGPVQVSVYETAALDMFPVDSEPPEMDLEPDQLPEAVQEVTEPAIPQVMVWLVSLSTISGPFKPSMRTSTIGGVVKAAVTDLLLSIVTVQPPVPEQAPDQPEKVEPAEGEAVRVTEVPISYSSKQSPPQLMPVGLLAIVPEPVPDLET